jgi:hypothetical protein
MEPRRGAGSESWPPTVSSSPAAHSEGVAFRTWAPSTTWPGSSCRPAGSALPSSSPMWRPHCASCSSWLAYPLRWRADPNRGDSRSRWAMAGETIAETLSPEIENRQRPARDHQGDRLHTDRITGFDGRGGCGSSAQRHAPRHPPSSLSHGDHPSWVPPATDPCPPTEATTTSRQAASQAGSLSNSSRSRSTRVAMSSRMVRTTSRGWPAGSGSSQSR